MTDKNAPTGSIDENAPTTTADKNEPTTTTDKNEPTTTTDKNEPTTTTDKNEPTTTTDKNEPTTTVDKNTRTVSTDENIEDESADDRPALSNERTNAIVEGITNAPSFQAFVTLGVLFFLCFFSFLLFVVLYRRRNSLRKLVVKGKPYYRARKFKTS